MRLDHIIMGFQETRNRRQETRLQFQFRRSIDYVRKRLERLQYSNLYTCTKNADTRILFIHQIVKNPHKRGQNKNALLTGSHQSQTKHFYSDPNYATELPDDNSEREPPDSIPNSEVKLLSADGSVGFPHVRVGHC